MRRSPRTDSAKSAGSLTRACLARIADPNGEGRRSFTQVYAERAFAEADASDRIVAPLAGIPISVKDLFDISGEVTTAGSTVLESSPAASADAEVVRRLRAAGAVIIGRTNMTEFAYSALGLNPHHGTPRNPHDPSRIPGGSSSGAATAVAYDFCVASIGTDTAGSVRVPAAFCGLVGFKPTQARIPRTGMFPLSSSLDSVGPIARTVADCALLDAIMAGDSLPRIPVLPMRGLRFAIPTHTWTEALDPIVGRAYERTLRKLSAAGAQLMPQDFTSLGILDEVTQCGGLIGPEAYEVHRALLRDHGAQYDPRVRSRLEEFENAAAANYLDGVRLRNAAIERFMREIESFDAVLAPTVAIVPPRFDELEDDDEYRRLNAVVKRNAAAVNLLDGCALSLPCHDPDELPVGLMVIGGRNADTHILAVGMVIEGVLSGSSAHRSGNLDGLLSL